MCDLRNGGSRAFNIRVEILLPPVGLFLWDWAGGHSLADPLTQRILGICAIA